MDFAPKAVILSGGLPTSVTEATTPRAPQLVFELGVPVLGICYGQMTLCAQLGAPGRISRPSRIRPAPPWRSPATAGCSKGCGSRARRNRPG